LFEILNDLTAHLSERGGGVVAAWRSIGHVLNEVSAQAEGYYSQLILLGRGMPSAMRLCRLRLPQAVAR
jgi:hypothetical protein